MKKIDLIYIVVSALFAAICYLTTVDIIYSVILLILSNSYYFLILRKKLKNHYSLIERVHTCYHYINSFIVTLSVKESYDDAFESATRINNKVLNDQIKELGNYNIYDRVKYLRQYFNLSIYKMFLNVLDLYQDQGGNILNMSDNLIRECTRTEKTLGETRQIGFKHLVEFLLLWSMATGILVFVRFSISDFYFQMLSNPIFKPMIFMFFLIILLSVHLFFSSYVNLSIKEDSGS